MYAFVCLSLCILCFSTAWAQFNETDFSSEWNSTDDQTVSITFVQDSTPTLQNEISSEDSWRPDVNPILNSIRNFFLQARDNFLESDLLQAASVLENDSQVITDHVIDILEKSFKEVTTMLRNESTATPPTVFQTTPAPIDMRKISNENFTEKTFPRPLNSSEEVPSEQQSVNTSFLTSYSQCFTSLHSCVQKCFVEQNCHNVERDARECPPVPPRMCNPFVPWLPADHCKADEDCKSPLICCSDGCVERCVAGVWRKF